MSRFITRFADVVKIPTPVLKSCNLNDCVEGCRLFLEQMCREKNITLHLLLSTENIPVNIDTTLFEQVLVNIIKNSIESIGENGEISITTSNSPASIVVTDNGRGIDKETERHLFSPFFTTKADGQGIGLIFIREVLGNPGCRYSLRTDSDNLTRFTISF